MSLLLLVVTLLVSPDSREPEFVLGDLSELRARTVSSAALVKDGPGTLLWVEVSNSGQHQAEPVAFRVTPKGKKATPVEAARVSPPSFGRAGRAVAPRKKLRYPLVVPLERNVAKKAKVEVVAASFFDGRGLVAEPPVVVGRPRTTTTMQFTGDRLEKTTVRLENELDVRVDLVFLAKSTGRAKGEGLFHASLGAREAKEVTWDTMVTRVPGGGGFSGVELSKLELVDWSTVASDGADLAAELLARAWAARAHLPDDRLGVTAPCTVTLHGHNRVDEQACTLGFDETGAWRVADPGELEGGPLSELEKYLRDLRCPVAERAFPGAAAGAKVTRLGDELTVLHVGAEGGQGRYVGILGDAILFRGYQPDGEGLVDRWTTRYTPEGWLLEGLETHANSVGNARADLQWEWKRHGDDWLPRTMVLANAGNHLWPERFELDFGAWSD